MPVHILGKRRRFEGWSVGDQKYIMQEKKYKYSNITKKAIAAPQPTSAVNDPFGLSIEAFQVEMRY